MDWSFLTPDQQFTAMVAFISACFGGGISLIVSVVTISISQKIERRKRELERIQGLRAQAYTGLIKLMTITNSFYSTKLHIDNAFEAARAEGRGDSEPCMIVQRTVGIHADIPELEPDELYFLVEARAADLINEVILIQQRLRVNNAAMVQYNQLKSKLDEFVEAHGKIESETSALAFQVSFAPEDAGFLRAQTATLNDLLKSIMEYGERDYSESTEVLRRYQEIAEKHFSAHGFPKIKIGEVLENAPS